MHFRLSFRIVWYNALENMLMKTTHSSIINITYLNEVNHIIWISCLLFMDIKVVALRRCIIVYWNVEIPVPLSVLDSRVWIVNFVWNGSLPILVLWNNNVLYYLLKNHFVIRRCSSQHEIRPLRLMLASLITNKRIIYRQSASCTSDYLSELILLDRVIPLVLGQIIFQIWNCWLNRFLLTHVDWIILIVSVLLWILVS